MGNQFRRRFIDALDRGLPTIDALRVAVNDEQSRDPDGKFGSGGGHNVHKVEPTQHGAKYHIQRGKFMHQIELTKKGGFVSHSQEGMTGSYEHKISKSIFPELHASAKAHLKEHGPHPESGGEEKSTGKSLIGSQVKKNAAASAKTKRML